MFFITDLQTEDGCRGINEERNRKIHRAAGAGIYDDAVFVARINWRTADGPLATTTILCGSLDAWQSATHANAPFDRGGC